jgi:hypothetical protein
VDSASPALILELSDWVQALHLGKAGAAVAFTEAYPNLRAQVDALGALLDSLEQTGAEVADTLFQVASNLLQVLDIAWDAAQESMGVEDFEEASVLLAASYAALVEETSSVEEMLEELSTADGGVDL